MMLNSIKDAIRSMVFKRAIKKTATEETVNNYLEHSLKMWSHSPTIQAFIHQLRLEIEDQGINMFCRLHQHKLEARRNNRPLPQAPNNWLPHHYHNNQEREVSHVNQ